MTDWTTLSARASMASHRLIGWIYWDPVAIEAYTALGIENGFGYYAATRGAPLAAAGQPEVRRYRAVYLHKDSEVGEPSDVVQVTFSG